MKRDEYCIIWRDTNFSKNLIDYNPSDYSINDYNGDLVNKINQKAKFNLYICSTSEEALKLIRRKKYNKIILISNIGTDCEGKTFVENARKIIKSNTIVLFNDYNINHFDLVENFQNALFSNETKFFEEYLECFYKNTLDETSNSIMELKERMEKHYKIKFNFDNSFLEYHYTKDQNLQFKDLLF